MSIKVTYKKGHKIIMDSLYEVGILFYEDEKYSPILTTFELQVSSPNGVVGKVRKIRFWFTKPDTSNSKYLIRKIDEAVEEMKGDLIKAGCREEYAKFRWHGKEIK